MGIRVRWHSMVLIALALAVAGVALRSISRRGAGGGPEPVGEAPCAVSDGEECPAELVRTEPGAPTNGLAVLPATEVCARAGYLCVEGDRAAGTFRVWRWPSATAGISIAVPEPDHLPPGEARELQRAAIRGIRSWTGHPFPLTISMGPAQAGTDVVVTWSSSLGEGRLGRAQVEWSATDGQVRVRVLGLHLATRAPGPEGLALEPRQVELVAAHEMGHVLGLPHSDDPRDVMYPENTSTRLTSRDFLTLEALYRLPNGAEVRR